MLQPCGRPSGENKDQERVSLRRRTLWGRHMTIIAVQVAGCMVNGALVGLETSRHLVHFIFGDKAGARTGKDSADFFVSVHLAPFIQTKCFPSLRLSERGDSPNFDHPEQGRPSIAQFRHCPLFVIQAVSTGQPAIRRSPPSRSSRRRELRRQSTCHSSAAPASRK